jgi:hypothetical protein
MIGQRAGWRQRSPRRLGRLAPGAEGLARPAGTRATGCRTQWPAAVADRAIGVLVGEPFDGVDLLRSGAAADGATASRVPAAALAAAAR